MSVAPTCHAADLLLSLTVAVNIRSVRGKEARTNRMNRALARGVLVLSVALPLQAGVAVAAHGRLDRQAISSE